MIEFLETWIKNLGISIVIISILEMLLPNNKTKKYVKMIMSIYILYVIISPFINNKFEFEDLDIEKYSKYDKASIQTSSSIENLYGTELENNIKNRIEEEGYEVEDCIVDISISNNINESKINRITLNVKKSENSVKQINKNEITIENIIVEGVTGIKQNLENDKLNKIDKNKILKILSEEYEVEEECLVIN